MASAASVLLSCVLAAYLMGGHVIGAREEGVRTAEGTASRGRGDKAKLLRATLCDIYSRSAQMLKRELRNSLAVVDGALSGDRGLVKRNAAQAGTGTTSLGSGPLYFLTREVARDETASEFYDAVESNSRIFDTVGK